jgi:hypothetical protein
MLGVTQSVDMIGSLRNDYGHVEVAVLDADILPSSIETVVTEESILLTHKKLKAVKRMK